MIAGHQFFFSIIVTDRFKEKSDHLLIVVEICGLNLMKRYFTDNDTTTTLWYIISVKVVI